MSDAVSRWQWRPDPRLWILAGVLVPLLAGLGVWQLERGSQKSGQAERWAERDEPAQWPPESVRVGEPVTLRGEYDPQKIWMLDNRTRDGRRGYEVLNLFHTDEGRAVVNRGWVAGTGDRDRLPEVSVPSGPVRLKGRVSDWPQPLVLGEVDPVNDRGWPRRVAQLTPDRVAARDEPVHAAFVRIGGEAQPGALRTGWDSDRMGAATHYGYAAQWFALAVLLLTLTLATSFRKREDQ